MYSKIICLLILLITSLNLQAQTVTIYRAGTATSPTYSSIKTAVAAAMENDSLVLSADTFREQNIVIDKSLKIEGSGSVSGKSTIDPGTGSDSSILKFINSDYPSVSRTLIIGYVDIVNGKANNGLDSGGGAIFAGIGTILKLNGMMKFSKNQAPDSSLGFSGSRNGGAIYSEGEVYVSGYDVVFENNAAVNGGAIYSTNKLVLDFWVKIQYNNASQNGGAIYTNGVLDIIGECNVSINNAANGGACFAENAELYIKGKSSFSLNHVTKLGGVLFLKNSYCNISENPEFNGNRTDSNLAAVLFCTGNNDVNIRGANMIYNRSTNMSYNGLGMAIYNANVPGASSIFTVNNSRIFNPKFDDTRQNEFYNAQAVSAFLSDSTWWGESDTSGLMYNAPTATVALRSWIVCEWIVNAGLPIDTAKKFPLEAHFSLFTGAPIPSKMFWMLEGYFSSDSGTFSPSIAPMNAANIVGSVYNVPLTSGIIHLNAVIDADSFKKSVFVIGLGIAPSKSLVNGISVFPNPATNYLTLRSTLLNNKPAQLTITDMLGKTVLSQELQFTQQDMTIPINLMAGNYVVNLWQDNQPLGKQKIIVQ